MKRLLLMRHAKSDWPAGVTDHERPLAPRGHRDAPRMAREMSRLSLRPDHVVVSTARRTRETFTLIEPFLGSHGLQYERAIYEASPEAILRVIRSIPATVDVLMIIGHNPGLEVTASYLVRNGGTAADPLDGKFPTAALAVMDFEIGTWSDISGRQGRLEAFLVPKQLP